MKKDVKTCRLCSNIFQKLKKKINYQFMSIFQLFETVECSRVIRHRLPLPRSKRLNFAFFSFLIFSANKHQSHRSLIHVHSAVLSGIKEDVYEPNS